MARIVFPSRFLDWIELFRKVFAADLADTNHTLAPFLTEEGYVMDDDKDTADAAVGFNTAFDSSEKNMDKFYKDRDFIFLPLFEDHRGCVQFLKKLYRKNPKTLGDWGVQVDGESKVVYPIDFLGKTKSMQTFITKHFSYVSPAVSPLTVYLIENEIDLADNDLAITKAVQKNSDATKATSDKEINRVDRDTKINIIESHLRGEGGYLVGLFSSNPNKAGDWGFRVDTSKQAPVLVTFILEPTQTKTIVNVNNGSVVVNIGTTDSNLYIGDTTGGEIIPFNANGHFLVEFGSGTLTIVNKDVAKKGSYQYEKN